MLLINVNYYTLMGQHKSDIFSFILIKTTALFKILAVLLIFNLAFTSILNVCTLEQRSDIFSLIFIKITAPF